MKKKIETPKPPELTNKQLDAQDLVNNTIHELLLKLAPEGTYIKWNIEKISEVREAIEEALKLTDQQSFDFFPWIPTKETQNDKDQAISYCQNCNRIWLGVSLKPIKDLQERVDPGEPIPSGECPNCGALCQLLEPVY